MGRFAVRRRCPTLRGAARSATQGLPRRAKAVSALRRPQGALFGGFWAERSIQTQMAASPSRVVTRTQRYLTSQAGRGTPRPRSGRRAPKRLGASGIEEPDPVLGLSPCDRRPLRECRDKVTRECLAACGGEAIRLT